MIIVVSFAINRKSVIAIITIAIKIICTIMTIVHNIIVIVFLVVVFVAVITIIVIMNPDIRVNKQGPVFLKTFITGKGKHAIVCCQRKWANQLAFFTRTPMRNFTAP